VKPKNILILSGKSNNPYDVKFKLGDLGLSHFKRTLKPDRMIVDGDVGGTKDYGKLLPSYSWKASRADVLKKAHQSAIEVIHFLSRSN
jgi:hypothetical protein